MFGSTVVKIEYYLPEKILSNDNLMLEFPEWDASKIEKKVGIKNRHVTTARESALDMALKASEKILKDFNSEDIDFILFCTQSPEYFLPSGACIIQDKLGLSKNIGALDFNLGCSGFVYGLTLADSLIKSGAASNVLLINSETYSKHIHPRDKSNRAIFGDGAAATIISTSNIPKIGKFVLGTDGSGFNKLIVRDGAFRDVNHQREYEESLYDGNYIYMNGPDIFNFTMDVVPKVVSNCLNLNALDLDDVDFYIFHQANKYILDFLRKKIKIPKEKFYVNMEETGNTVSATIPIALRQCLDNKLVKAGDKVMLVGFGVGLSWASCIIEV